MDSIILDYICSLCIHRPHISPENKISASLCASLYPLQKQLKFKVSDSWNGKVGVAYNVHISLVSAYMVLY